MAVLLLLGIMDIAAGVVALFDPVPAAAYLITKGLLLWFLAPKNLLTAADLLSGFALLLVPGSAVGVFLYLVAKGLASLHV